MLPMKVGHIQEDLALLHRLREDPELGLDVVTDDVFAGILDLDRRLDGPELRVAIIAEANAGKSTFMNALAGEELVAAGIRRGLTSFATEFRYGPSRRIEVEFRTGQKVAIQSADQLRGLTGEDAEAQRIRVARVWLPSRFLQNGVVVVDTPGVNVDNLAHVAATQQEVEQAHAAVFLFECGQAATKSALDFLRSVSQHIDRFFFVLNKCDDYEPDEVAEAVEYLSASIEEECGIPASAPATLSAREALSTAPEAEPYRQAFEEFVADLRRTLNQSFTDLLVVDLLKAETSILTTVESRMHDRVRLAEQELEAAYGERFPDVTALSQQLVADAEEAVILFYAAWRSETEERIADTMSRTRESVYARISAARSKKEVIHEVPPALDEVIRSAWSSHMSSVHRTAAEELQRRLVVIDEALVSRFQSIRNVGLRLVFRQRLPYWLGAIALAIAAILPLGLPSPLRFGLATGVGCAGFLLGVLIGYLRTRFSYVLPYEPATAQTGSVTAAMSALASADLAERAAVNQAAMKGGTQIAIHTARAAATMGAGAAMGFALPAIGIGLAIYGVAKLLDHFFGPKLDDLKDELRSKVADSLITMESELRRERASLIDRLETLSRRAIRDKVDAALEKYKSLLAELLELDRRRLAGVEQRVQRLQQLHSDLQERAASVTRARDEQRVRIRGRQVT